MKKLTFLFTVILLASCAGHDAADSILDSAQEYLEDRPGQALDILENIDKDILTTRKTRARHALLHSIALDKNHIDITNDSTINIAINWYSRHGSHDSRFKAYYYQARIYENAGNSELALESIIKAESINYSKVDPAYIGRLYFIKKRIYMKLMEYEQAAKAAELAGKYSMEGKKVQNYYLAKMDIATICILTEDFEKAKDNLDYVNKYIDNLSISNRHYFYDTQIRLAIMEGRDIDVEVIPKMQEYLAENPQEEYVNWIIVAETYNRGGMYDKAMSALDLYATYNNVSNNDAYHLLRSETYELLGDKTNALNSYKTYFNIRDSLDTVIYDTDTKFIEERHSQQLKIIRYRTIFAAAGVILVLSIIVIARYFVKRKKYERHLNKLLADIKKEYAELLSVNENNSKLHYEARMILDIRIKTLARFLSRDLPDSISKIADDIEELTKDRQVIVDNIGLLYSIYHPNFVNYLEERGLTLPEVGYCCLLLLGVKTSEIGSIIYRSSTYNISSKLRKKLGLEAKSTKLAIWLKEAFDKTEKNDIESNAALNKFRQN